MPNASHTLYFSLSLSISRSAVFRDQCAALEKHQQPTCTSVVYPGGGGFV